MPGRPLPGCHQSYVKIETRSVLAWRNERAEKWGAPRIRTETITVGAQDFKLLSWCGGPWEVYRVTMSGPEKGLEIFLGYAPDAIRAIAPKRKAATP